VLAVGAGEAALLVAEDLAFDQVRRDRAAVDREEGALAAPAQVVDGLRDDLLAGAALAGDENFRVGSSDTIDLLTEIGHRRTRTYELGSPIKAHVRPVLLAAESGVGSVKCKQAATAEQNLFNGART